ncbi:V-type ATP synthase subunit I [bacterium]
MAIEKIKKIDFAVYKDDIHSFFNFLQKNGTVQLNQTSLEVLEEDGLNTLQNKSIVNTENQKALNQDLAKVTQVISFLNRFKKKGFLDSIIEPKDFITKDEFEKIKQFDHKVICSTILSKIKKLDDTAEEQSELDSIINQITPWQSIQVNLDELIGTKWTRIIAAAVDNQKFSKISEYIKENESDLIVVNKTKKETFLAIITINSLYDQTIQEVNKYGKVLYWQMLGYAPKEIIDRCYRRKRVLTYKSDKINKTIKNYLPNLSKLRVVYDNIHNQWLNETKKENAATISKITLLQGFIAQKNIEKITNECKNQFSDIMINTTEPKPNDNVPILLKNNPVIKPFETITKLYGQPSYKSLDPTAYLAPFFIVFFGICLADVGYGLLMALMSIVMIYFFKARFGKKADTSFLKLLGYMGVFCILFGALTGNWLGNLYEKLPENYAFIKHGILNLRILNPMHEKGSLVFLGISLILGFTQLWFAVFVQFINKIKEKDYKNAYLLELPTLGIQTSLLPLALYYVLEMKILPAFLMQFFTLIFILSVITIAYKQWISNEGIFIKLFWCVYGNYSVITGNFLADTLSYARLFALGLSSGLLALAINEISMVFANVPVVGVFLMVIVIIVGHLFNLAISFLGSFVHSCRLQYLEFFTKFFESGGEEFQPFEEKREYTVITG